MLRDLIAAGLAFISAFLFIFAWPDQVMLGLLSLFFAILAAATVFTAPKSKRSDTP